MWRDKLPRTKVLFFLSFRNEPAAMSHHRVVITTTFFTWDALPSDGNEAYPR